MGVNWLGSPKSWSPIIGCGGDNLPCIARCWARKFCRRGMHPDHRKVAKRDGTVILREKELEKPIHRSKPTLYAACLLGDLFHRNVTVRQIAEVFDVMASATTECGKRHEHEEECWTGDPHTFILCTKRADRMRKVMSEELPDDFDEYWPGDCCANVNRETGNWPLENVWLGVSVSGDQDAHRVDDLLATPAAHHWLSYEPALSRLTLKPEWLEKLSCIITGCEAGPGRRSADDDWLDNIDRQCRGTNVKVFCKQREFCGPKMRGVVKSMPLPTEWPWVRK